MAFIVGATLGAVGAIAGGLIGAHGASQAASAQENAAHYSADMQYKMWQESLGISAPTRNLGYGADTKLAQLFGINPGTLNNSQYSMTPNGQGQDPNTSPIPGTYGPRYGGQGGRNGIYNPSGDRGPLSGGTNGPPNMSSTGGGTTPGSQSGQSSTPNGNPDYSGFYNSPGFQFAKDLGNQQIARSQAAKGGLYSANTQTLESQYTTGFASQHYNDYVSQLLQMAGFGANSSTASGANAVSTGQGISNSIIGGGNASAAGSVGEVGAITGAIGGAYNAYRGYANNQPSPWSGTPADIQNADYNNPVPKLIGP